MSELRKITKIDRNLSLLKNKEKVNSSLSESTYETLRIIDKHPGCSSSFLSRRLDCDKSLISRNVRFLLKKGLIFVVPDSKDKRSKLLYPTKTGLDEKLNNESFENTYYDYLEKFIPEKEREQFITVLDEIYKKSKELRKNNFKDIKEL
jgi:DNA-binding MarR family transcriptional regulator